MKDLPERANWKRLPTTGKPGGPGGRFRALDLKLREKNKRRAEMIKTSIVKRKAMLLDVVGSFVGGRWSIYW